MTLNVNSFTSNRCGVCVVGAGPAGSTAARMLAEAGLDVLLIDKESFPRNKPCGGIIPAFAFEDVPFSPKSVGAEPLDSVSLCISGREYARLPLSPPIYSVTRLQFDAALQKSAISAGARFQIAKALDFRCDQNLVFVNTDNGQIVCDTLVCCDGASGVFSRAMRASMPFDTIPCVEMSVRANRAPDFPARIDLKYTSDFYAWAFAKGGGMFSCGFGGKASKAAFAQPSAACDLFFGKNNYTIAHTDWCSIRIYKSGAHDYAAQQVYLCGEAAALVDPVLGEGIRFAISSAKLAAKAIVSGAGHDAYTNWVRELLCDNFDKSYKLASRFREIPKLALIPLVYLPRGKKMLVYFTQLLSGEMDYNEMYRRYKSDKG